MADWTARRILKELADAPRRRAISAAFWKGAEPQQRQLALAQLAASLRFRIETLRKTKDERKAELLVSRLHSAEFEDAFENALMLYHTHDQAGMLAAFLDAWNIPHVNGSIEVDEYKAPTAAEVQSSVTVLRERFELRDILIYLASAGLLMGEGMPAWRDATWPAVNELSSALATEPSP
ncbi:MAG: hypothetical protein ABI718_13145 [Acidobacteriota bacterium]